MNQLKSLLKFATCAALMLSLHSTALAFVTYESFKPKLFETDLTASYFNATTSYKKSGDTETLPSGNYYRQIDFGARARYVVYPRWSLIGGTVLSSAEAQGVDTANRTTKRTNSSISEISLGAQYFMGFYADTELFPEIVLHYPLEKVNTDATADVLPNSEGVYHLSSLLRIQRDFNSWRLFGNGGVGLRGGGRSTLLQYGIGFDVPMKSFIFGGELYGYESIIKDSEAGNAGSGDPDKDRVIFGNRVLGGSRKYYSYDPSLTSIAGFTKFAVSNWMTLGIGMGTSFRGSNAANGFFVEGLVSMSFDFGSKYDFVDESKKTKREFHENKQEAFEENLRFEEDVHEQVPPSYGKPVLTPSPKPRFAPPPPPRPKHTEPVIKLRRIQPRTKPAPQPRRTRPVDTRTYSRPMKKQSTVLPVDNGPSIQDELNNTEMQIKLKQDTKKRR